MLVNLKQKERRSITEHTSEFQGLVDQLTIMKIVPENELHVLLLLSFLFDSQKTLVVSVNDSVPNGKLTLDINRLRNEEFRRKCNLINIVEDFTILGPVAFLVLGFPYKNMCLLWLIFPLILFGLFFFLFIYSIYPILIHCYQHEESQYYWVIIII